MKKITYTIGFAFAMLATSNAVAQQGFGTNRPEKSAAVEIKSPNKGLLIPRIALTSTTDVTTVLNPANSLLVYNETASDGLHAGYYYFKASANKWIPLLDETIQSHVTVTQDGQNLSVVGTQTTNTNGSTSTDYKVKITPGADKQFLATVMVGTELQTTWVSYADVMEVTNGLTKTGNTIKLGGRLTEDTTIITDGNAVKIQGLSQVTNMTDQVVAVGHYETGEVKVATPEQIVTAGTTHNLASQVNTMTSTINGVDKTAPIVNTNLLSIDANTTILKSTVNGVEGTQDIKQAIQLGQIKYEVKSTDESVTVTPSTLNDLTTFDLQVTGINDGIQVGNGISKEAGTNKVILGGDLDRATTIKTNGNAVMIEGLSQVTSMTDQVIAVGHQTTGEVKVATPAQIVEAGIAAENGITADGNTVKLGGNLTEDTTIVTAGKKVMIQGLSQVPDMTDQVVAVGHYETGEVKVATPGQIVSSTLANGSGTTAVFDAGTQTNKVNLGGLLTENAVITTTDAETLAIAGLQDFTGDEKSIVVLGPGNVLQKASLNTSNAISTQTANYNALATDETILVDASDNHVEITLPAADNDNKGKRFYVKLIATNTANTNEVRINSASLIDGDASAIVSSSPYQAWLFQSNGTGWFVVGN